MECANRIVVHLKAMFESALSTQFIIRVEDNPRTTKIVKTYIYAFNV